MVPTEPGQDRREAWLLAAFAIIFAFMAWAHAFAAHIDRPLIDEEIVVAVLDHVSAEDTLDTNWADVESVARSYPSTQYNFSAAILAYGLVSGEIFNAEPLADISFRHVPILFAAGALLLGFLASGRLGGGAAAFGTVVLTALSYQFLTEAVSIRPEAFIYLFYTAALAAAVWHRPPLIVSAIMVGLCGGLLIAAKFSLVLVWLQALALMMILRLPLTPDLGSLRAHWRTGLLLTALSLAGCLAGIALGAPHALLDPSGTVQGMSALLGQYGNAHYPFGRPDAGLFTRAGHAILQTQSHLGALTLVLALVATGLAVRARQWAIAFLAISTLIIIGYFALKPVFFARNISLFIPVLAFLASWAVVQLAGRLNLRWQSTAFAGLLLVLATQPALASLAVFRAGASFEERQLHHAVTRSFLEVRTGKSVRIVNGWDAYRDPARLLAGSRGNAAALVELKSLNDPFSRSVRRWLVDAPHASLHDPGSARLEHLPHSMVHYNFDLDHRFVWIDPAGAAPLPEMVPQAVWCPDPLAAQVEGSFSQDGFHGEARLDDPAFGSWLDSDAATATATLRLPSIPPGTVLPVLTGPGRDGLTIRVNGARPEAVFTDGHWIGLALPERGGETAIIIEDNGIGWGEWIAFALPRRICR